MIKECQEEASIPEALARKATPCGAVSCAFMMGSGLKRDVLFVYDLELPPDFQPKPQDGEVGGTVLCPHKGELAFVKCTPLKLRGRVFSMNIRER